MQIVFRGSVCCGLDVSFYSGHSFRIGGATTAVHVGINDAIIKQLGWRKSSA